MAHELVDTVTATPTGPVAVVLGGSVDVTGSFTLNGPPAGSPTASNYTMTWTHLSPGVPFSIAGTVDPASPNTDYTNTFSASDLGSVGIHTVGVYVVYVNDVPYTDTTYSNTITVNVRRPFEEENAAAGAFAEENAAAGNFTEQPPAAGAFAEEDPAAGAFAEESPAAGSWTEQQLED